MNLDDFDFEACYKSVKSLLDQLGNEQPSTVLQDNIVITDMMLQINTRIWRLNGEAPLMDDVNKIRDIMINLHEKKSA